MGSATLPSRTRQAAKAMVLVACGITQIARRSLRGQGCVLTFHGLREDGTDCGIRDESLHLPTSVFREICQTLAVRHHVVPLPAMIRALKAGETLPAGTVAITFDDGYESNYRLAFPVLREFGLPATIFLTTGFLDQTDFLWFQRVDRACHGASHSDLAEKLTHLKTLPDADMRAEVDRLESVNPLAGATVEDLPPVMRPMSWDQAREMQRSGWVDFGSHTHTHPILARCSPEQQRTEIEFSQQRIREELGIDANLFAYPNGGPSDFTRTTQHLLEQAGITAAFTMTSGHVEHPANLLELPRYGSPESHWEAAATASGAFHMAKQWRQGCRRILGGNR